MAENKAAPVSVGRDQVLAFRAGRHNLAARLPSGALLEAASACGIRNSPPGSAELAFHARVTNFSTGQLENALATAKTLLEALSMRSSPFLFPARDLAIFTSALLPPDEASLRFYLKTALPTIDQAQKKASETLELVATAMCDALDGCSLPRGELSTEVSQRMPKELLFWCKGCQANHVNETLFRLAAQKARLCFIRKAGSDSLFTRSDQWLDASLPPIDSTQNRAEVLRRYLRCYGPSTPAHYATWAGISTDQAKLNWQLLEAQLTEVNFENTKSWLLQEDLDLLKASSPASESVRLLPPYDPYLLLSDRTTLVPNKNLHPELWRALGNPGVVLVGGEVAGMWRPQKKGKRLLLNVTLFGPIPAYVRSQIEAEAELLTPLKGCTNAEISIEG